MSEPDPPDKSDKLDRSRPPRTHSIADHAFGALVAHVHAPGEDHDHDHDHDGHDLLPAGASDDVVLMSIGIDVGSSGTQVAFARLMLERTLPAPQSLDANGQDITQLTTRRRETIYQSPIYLTPFADENRVDADALGRLLDQAFEGAGLDPDAIDCGVVILTGAARERHNAQIIARRLAETCGDIVSASAGHHLEARLAAHGSGAVARSAEFAQRYLNIDIGGGTTKLAICDAGRIVETAAIAIGGRLVATDTTDRIVRLEPWGARHAADAGIVWQPAGTAPWPERQHVAREMAAKLVAALTGRLDATTHAALHLTAPLSSLDGIDGVIVSGGVGEYVYGRERRSFGDLGLPLGRGLASLIDAGALPWPLMPAAECIRATVLGASSYSVQLSGRTGCITNPATLLPRRNLPVVQPHLDLSGKINPDAGARTIADLLAAHDFADAAATTPILALRWQGEPDHTRLAALADGVKRGFIDHLPPATPLYIVVDGDIAASLGTLLRDEFGVASDLLVLDGIALDDLDYVDLGRIRLPSGTVPVTIKTLVFRDEREQKAPRKSPRPARQGGPG
jgi:ethanolamine utilization protein EutA